MMEKYEPLGVVGEGSYGVVLKCRNRESGRTVAIKKFIDTEDDQNVRKIALREIRVLRKLHHENLVNLLEVFRRRKHLYLVFEFIDHTLLDELENKSHGLDDETSRKYVYQILRGLGFCHDNNIIHRDVKPENVLVSKNGIVKLCDFGFARNLCAPGEQYTDYVATRWYRAPELLVGDVAYGKEVDIWAVGCLFSEMMSGEPLFPGDSDIDQLFLIAQCLGRLARRHLKIMSKNSAFRGFQFPKSRHGSTASTDSNSMNTNTKLAKFDSSTNLNGIGIGKEGSSSGHRYPSTKSTTNKRTTSVDKSVFAEMFPSWTDEAVQFLTLCLDPEPPGRPNCNALIRLPYFTIDNFPSRFIGELNAKLQLEGRNPIPSFSTRKKRNAGALKPPNGANVTSSLSPSHQNHNPNQNSNQNLTQNPGGLQRKNPLYQTRSNLNEDPPPENNISFFSNQNQNQTGSTIPPPQLTKSQRHQTSSKTPLQSQGQTFASNAPMQIPTVQPAPKSQNFSTPFQSQTSVSVSNAPKFNLVRDQTFLVDKISKISQKKPSFSQSTEITSRIPTLLSRNSSDDFILKNIVSTSSTSIFNSNLNQNAPQNPQTFPRASKSTPNIAEENLTPSPNPNTNPTNQINPHTLKEKRFSIQNPVSYNNLPQPPQQLHRKYSYSFPTATETNTNTNNSNSAGEDNRNLQNTENNGKIFHHLPVTTLTFSLGPHTLNYNNANATNISNNNYPYSIHSVIKSPNNNPNSTPNGTYQQHLQQQHQQKRTPSPSKSKPFSVNNNSSSYFPQTQHFSTNNTCTNNAPGSGHDPRGGGPPTNFYHGNHSSLLLGNSKSLPIPPFSSSLRKNSGESVTNNSNGESFLPRMNVKNLTSSGNSIKDENNSASLLNTTSPTKAGTSSLSRNKREVSTKWDQQSQGQGGGVRSQVGGTAGRIVKIVMADPSNNSTSSRDSRHFSTNQNQ